MGKNERQVNMSKISGSRDSKTLLIEVRLDSYQISYWHPRNGQNLKIVLFIFKHLVSQTDLLAQLRDA